MKFPFFFYATHPYLYENTVHTSRPWRQKKSDKASISPMLHHARMLRGGGLFPEGVLATALSRGLFSSDLFRISFQGQSSQQGSPSLSPGLSGRCRQHLIRHPLLVGSTAMPSQSYSSCEGRSQCNGCLDLSIESKGHATRGASTFLAASSWYGWLGQQKGSLLHAMPFSTRVGTGSGSFFGTTE